MARTKEFDPAAALAAALELFWERGYAATSMADLVDHLGIARASIYATFGNKHQLYLRALRHYEQTRDPSPIEVLSRPGPVLPALRRLVRAYAADAADDVRRRGCFVANTAAELARGDAAAARQVEASWGALETALESALHRALAQGELAADADPRGLARFLLVVLQGLRLVGQGAPDPDRLRDAAEHALRALS